MKQIISASDIREGDLIRWEDDTTENAVEYRADYDTHRHFTYGTHYLLDRPIEAIEPFYGMIVGSGEDARMRAAYIPSWHGDLSPWLISELTANGEDQAYWTNTHTIQNRLANGWEIMDAPKGVE